MANCPLGKKSEYPSQYDSSLLFPVARSKTRVKMGIDSSLFHGVDEWNCYEVSWLDKKGKPEVRILRIIYPADSEFIIESKSLKLYLNSFNMDRFKGEDSVLNLMRNDLKSILKTKVEVNIYENAVDVDALKYVDIDNSLLIDDLDVAIDKYYPEKSLLITSQEAKSCEHEVYSNLLKTIALLLGNQTGELFILNINLIKK